MTVRALADGTYEVTAGTSIDSYDDLKEALNAELAAVATFEKPTYFRDDAGEPNGEWRWLYACSIEPKAVRGVRIDAEAIREMADSLNTKTRAVPIDGGPTPPGMLPSEVHGTPLTGGATLSNGRAHWGVVVEGPDEDQAQLYLWAELLPIVAKEIDAGRMAEGSVAFKAGRYDGELARDIDFHSYALTNDPSQQDMAPANSVRRAVSLCAMRAATPKEIRMSKTKTAAKKTTVRKACSHLRGHAMDKLAEVCTALGVDIDSEMDSEAWESPSSAALSALKTLASAEKVLEGAPPVAAPTMAPEQMSAPTRSDQAPGTEQRAVTYPLLGVPDEAGLAASLSQLCDALCAPLGLAADCDAAAVLDAVKVNTDKIAGACAMGAAGSADAPAPVAASDATRGDVAGAIELRSRILTLETDAKRKDARIAELEAVETRRAVERDVDVAFRAAGRLISDSDRTTLVDDLVATPDAKVRARSLARATGGGAPTGNVLGTPPEQSRSGATGGDDLKTIARRDFLPRLVEENAKLPAYRQQPRHFLIARAQKLAGEKHPHLLVATGSDQL